MVALIEESRLPFVGLTRIIFFLICRAIKSLHSPSITLALLSSESQLLLKNEIVFWTSYTFDFTVRKRSTTMRPRDRGQNHEYHCKSVRLERPALLSKNKLSSVKFISLETKLLLSNLLSSLLIALRKLLAKIKLSCAFRWRRRFPRCFSLILPLASTR